MDQPLTPDAPATPPEEPPLNLNNPRSVAQYAEPPIDLGDLVSGRTVMQRIPLAGDTDLVLREVSSEEHAWITKIVTDRHAMLAQAARKGGLPLPTEGEVGNDLGIALIAAHLVQFGKHLLPRHDLDDGTFSEPMLLQRVTIVQRLSNRVAGTLGQQIQFFQDRIENALNPAAIADFSVPQTGGPSPSSDTSGQG